jgi:4-hydroxy-2-oxoheptanedioate aldolase
MDAGGSARAANFGLKHPLVVKAPKIAPDFAKATENISRELNVGASGIMFVEVESAEEVRQGLAAMRFKSHGGTRPDDAGTAPAFWGMSEQQYKQKADLWPLNPDGELINWTIVESKEGLAHVREIAAVKGIGVLWPGAGTLRQVFSTTNAAGERVVDTVAHENAIQQVLAACKEFKVPCGYPANANDIETRMKQGFSVFVMNWGDAGFSAVDIGRKAAGRSSSSR